MDDALLGLLRSISSNANCYNERRLLRLLGVICEHAFIGPEKVFIDVYHRCNINCLHCLVHTPKIKHPQEFLDRELDFDLYKGLIDDFAELKLDNIIFQGEGEPLLYDKFLDMVEYAQRKNIDTSFFTNGLLLDNKIAQKVVDLGVKEIFCSVPAGTDKTYALIAHLNDLNALSRILVNLEYLTSIKRQVNKTYPKLIMIHVIHNLNYKEIMDIAKNDVEIGADVIRLYNIWIGDNVEFLRLKPEEIEVIKESVSKVRAYLKDKHVELFVSDSIDIDCQSDYYGKERKACDADVFFKERCLLGWFFCLVKASGDICLCRHRSREAGHLNEKRFKEIWNSKEYLRYRVQAKYLSSNKNITFLNGIKLYGQECEHCDTYPVTDIEEDFKKYNLERFI